MARRSRRALERAIESAADASTKAYACYELGLFHDNNSREAEAIPHYEAALALGLDAETRARCLAWLASSLYKTQRPTEALQRAEEAANATDTPDSLYFIDGLSKRIKASLGYLQRPISNRP